MKSPMKRAAPRKASAKRKPPSKVTALAVSPAHEEDMQYRAKDALHTLKRAHEIQQDPKLMGHVKQHAANERDILKKIARKS
jgi:hypothetical protein